MKTEERKDFQELLKPGTVVRCFKGSYYKILGVGIHTETEETLVVYKGLSLTDYIHIRPYDMFLSKVDKNKYPDADQEYRFEIAKGDVRVID